MARQYSQHPQQNQNPVTTTTEERPAVQGGKGGVVMTTRAGKRPDDGNEPYTITTEEMRVFLQRRLDVIIADVNRNLQEGNSPLPNMEIKAFSCRMGDRFYPIIITLPEAAMYRKEKKKNVQKDPRRINIQNVVDDDADEDDFVRLYTPIYECFKAFMYENGGKSMKHPEVRKNLGINYNSVGKVVSMCTPKRTKMNNGSFLITIMLDPFAIIHNMLYKDYDKREYTITMKRVDRMKDGVYRYKVSRDLRGKKKKGGGMDEYKALMQRISSGAGLR